MQKGTGKSKKDNPFEAGAEAAREALKKAGTDDCDIVFVHSTDGYENYEELLKGVKSEVGDASLVGTLAGGVIVGEGADEDLKCVAAMAVKSEEVKFTPVIVDGLGNDPQGVGEKLAEEVSQKWPEDKEAKLLLLYPGGLTVNPDSLFRGIENNLPKKLPFVGGTSGGTGELRKTLQFFDGEVFNDAVIGVAVSGDFNFEAGVSHGAVPSKHLKHTITKASGNIIHEVDDKPAIEIYRDFLGDELSSMNLLAQSTVCLGTKVPEDIKDQYEEVILRIPLQVLEDGSLVMAAEWPEGTDIFVCKRDPKNLIEKSRETSETIKENIKEKGKEDPQLIFHFNCLGRAGGNQAMGEEFTKEEIRNAREPFGEDVAWLGWYTYGEIAPIGEKNEFHNWTGVVLAIY